MSERTKLEMRDGVAWISMDDGKVNVMSADMLREIVARLDSPEARSSVTVLAGRSRIFSAGFDLGTFRRGAEATREMLAAGVEAIVKILEHPRPVVTACTGHAFPMGAFLMLAADLRYGVAGPWKIGMNEVAIGLILPHFALELARHRLTAPGYARATVAAMWEPERARELGYLDRVVAEGELEAAVQEAAKGLQALDMSAFVATKARINAAVIEGVRGAAERHSLG